MQITVFPVPLTNADLIGSGVHGDPVLWINFAFMDAATMDFTRPFLLHPSPPCCDGFALAGHHRVEGKHIEPDLEFSSSEMNEAAAAPAHARSARTSLEWLANCDGTNSVLPGKEKETDVSQSSQALSAEGAVIDAIT